MNWTGDCAENKSIITINIKQWVALPQKNKFKLITTILLQVLLNIHLLHRRLLMTEEAEKLKTKNYQITYQWTAEML